MAALIPAETNILSTVINWRKQDYSKDSPFPIWNIQHPSKQAMFTSELNPAQIFTNIPKTFYQNKLNKISASFHDPELALEIRWLYSKEVPSWSPMFLYMYLSRFTDVIAVYKQAINSCIVVFKDRHSVLRIRNKGNLGLPYGRLFIKQWNPVPQDNQFCKVTKYIEDYSSMKARFQDLSKRDFQEMVTNPISAGAKYIARGHKRHGPTFHRYIRGELPDKTYPSASLGIR